MITYREAMDLMRDECPIYCNGFKMRKITGLIWRRGHDSMYACAEVLDENMNCVSVVALKDISTCDDESVSVDNCRVLAKVNDLIGVLENMRCSLVYEDIDRAKDNYNRLIRECTKLDVEIIKYGEKLSNRKIIGMIDKAKIVDDGENNGDGQGLDYRSISAERAALDKRIEEFLGEGDNA